MCKSITVTVLVLLSIIAPSTVMAADGWEAYRQLMGNYYSLENQRIESVTCRVALSTLDPGKFREQLEPFGDKLVLYENLSDFKVTYSRKDGITFVEPHFDAVLISTEGAADPNRVEVGVKMINEGARMQIQGAMETIKALLDDFVPPKREALADVQVSSSEGTTTVKYRKGETTYHEVYVGKNKKTVTKTSGIETEASEELMELDGKLATAKGTIRLQQGGNIMNMTVAVQYQDLGSLFFPSVLDQQIQMSGPNLKQEVTMSISFTDCQTE